MRKSANSAPIFEGYIVEMHHVLYIYVTGERFEGLEARGVFALQVEGGRQGDICEVEEVDLTEDWEAGEF